MRFTAIVVFGSSFHLGRSGRYANAQALAELHLDMYEVVWRYFQEYRVAAGVRFQEELAAGAENHGALGIADAAKLGVAGVAAAFQDTRRDSVARLGPGVAFGRGLHRAWNHAREQ